MITMRGFKFRFLIVVITLGVVFIYMGIQDMIRGSRTPVALETLTVEIYDTPNLEHYQTLLEKECRKRADSVILRLFLNAGVQ